MALDPTKHADWEIAEDSETRMKTVYQLAEELGLEKEELLPHGHYVAKIDFNRAINRLGDKTDGKYVDVTAITPTPLGEGKSTTTMGLVQGLGKRNKNEQRRVIQKNFSIMSFLENKDIVTNINGTTPTNPKYS